MLSKAALSQKEFLFSFPPFFKYINQHIHICVLYLHKSF